jgi:hypothetical protein
MGVPHGNNAAHPAARGPDQHDDPAAQQPGGDEASLTIIPALVQLDRVPPGKQLGRIGEIQTPFPQSLRSLPRVEGDLHRIIIDTIMLPSIA